jgi:hypothetical protein
MGKKSPKAPAAPDPVATAQAQAAMNKETAIANAQLGNVDQYTPYGSLVYTQTGGNPVYNEEAYAKAMDAYSKSLENYTITQTTNRFGRTRTSKPAIPQAPKREDFLISKGDVPKFTSRITLSPEQQRLLDLTQQGDLGTAQLGLDQLGRISQSVSTPFSYAGIPSYGETDQTAAAARAEEALMARMNPQFQRDEEALRTRLINQGIGQGSQAYQREMESFNQARTDARTQAILSGQQFGSRELADALMRRNQGIQEYTTQRYAPLNEYSALTSGTQIQNPQFASAGSGGIAPVDYTGLVNNQYNAAMGQYNANVANRNANMGAVGQLLGTAGSFAGGPGSLFGYSLWGK